MEVIWGAEDGTVPARSANARCAVFITDHPTDALRVASTRFLVLTVSTT